MANIKENASLLIRSFQENDLKRSEELKVDN